MRRARWFAVSGLAVLAAAGLATATPAPVPPADPIGDVIADQPPAPPPEQTPPAQPLEITPIAPTLPADGLVTETPPMAVTRAETDADDDDEEEEAPLGTPLPELADALPRTRQGFAIVQALDKVTAESIRFAVPVGQQRRWRGLVFRARACEVTAADEPMRDAVAYLEIYSQPRMRDGRSSPREVFQGWMFASSPGLSEMQHPLYDVWVIACQAEAPTT